MVLLTYLIAEIFPKYGNNFRLSPSGTDYSGSHHNYGASGIMWGIFSIQS